MFNENPIIICGSGASINDGIEMGLFENLKSHITCGLNHWYSQAFEPTFTSFVDYQFYRDQIETLEKQVLIIGKFDFQLAKLNIIKENSILLPKSATYYSKDSWRIWERTCLKCGNKYEDDYRIPRPDKCPRCGGNQVQKFGIYSGHLSSLFALTLAIALGFKTIYLLGHDCVEYKGKTHFYQDEINLEKKNTDGTKIFHGVGMVTHTNGKKAYRTSTYNNVDNLNNLWYKPYIQVLSEVNIINVSIPSKINIFPKMDYVKFLQTIGKGNVNQDEIREEIKTYINEKIKR